LRLASKSCSSRHICRRTHSNVLRCGIARGMSLLCGKMGTKLVVN
jgi:hypothetical protein